MFDIKPESNMSLVEKLLYNIWQELKENKKVKETEIKQYICKTCGIAYDNKGQMLSCARKHKKEG